MQDKSHREEQCHSTLRVELRDVEGACQEILFVVMLARSYQAVKRFMKFLQGKSEVAWWNGLIYLVVQHRLLIALRVKSQAVSVKYLTCFHNDTVPSLVSLNSAFRHLVRSARMGTEGAPA